ncbi:toll-interacting protein-like [Haliotis asinina]|uniref:toll-interacting protein-like n=1 Tax=Haliotis asinina TaxID=109174 RepID=UPI00353273E1
MTVYHHSQNKMSASTNRRNQVMVGELPNDFLRISGQPTQMMEDERIAQILQAQQQAGVGMMPANIAGRLSITVVQAKLAKNYGLTKMDPYCRIRLGHTVFETPTASNGAKNPRWNKTVQTYLPNGVDSMYIEIFDERSFTVDDRIAWAHVTIPASALNGDTSDDWYPLSGRQGDEKEGMVNLVMSFTAAADMPASAFTYTTPAFQPVPTMMPMYYPAVQPVVVGVTPGMQTGVQPGMVYPQQMVPQQQPRGPLYTEQDLQQVKDMFPNMEEEVVKSVLEANRGNKDATINSLLSMNSD